MKKIYVLVVALCLILPQACLADEKADAEAAIAEAESLLEELNALGPWFGPALSLKMEAEKYLEMAKESFDAGKFSEALQHAEMAMESANGAQGLRAWLLLTRGRLVRGVTVPQPR
jgi:hypothetical protein